jgi:hypothetical protein
MEVPRNRSRTNLYVATLFRSPTEWIGGANSSASSGLGEFACGVLRTQIVLRWHLMGAHLIGMHLVGVDLCVYLIGVDLIGHKAD